MLRPVSCLAVLAGLFGALIVNAPANAADGAASAPAAAPAAAPAPTEPLLRKKPANPPEPGTGCGWIGRHAVLAIVREDVVASNDYMTLYERFGCEKGQVRNALDCTLSEPLSDQADQVLARVEACWPGIAGPTTR